VQLDGATKKRSTSHSLSLSVFSGNAWWKGIILGHPVEQRHTHTTDLAHAKLELTDTSRVHGAHFRATTHEDSVCIELEVLTVTTIKNTIVRGYTPYSLEETYRFGCQYVDWTELAQHRSIVCCQCGNEP
jgi:hypothetical protein